MVSILSKVPLKQLLLGIMPEYLNPTTFCTQTFRHKFPVPQGFMHDEIFALEHSGVDPQHH